MPGQPGHATGQPIVPGATPYGSAVATAPPEKVNADNGAWVLVDVQGVLTWAWAQPPADQQQPDASTKPTQPPPPTAGTRPTQPPPPAAATRPTPPAAPR